jgi:SAM-dependent methyltransferase
MSDVTQLSEAERQLMLVLGRAARRRAPSDIPNLERIARLEIGAPLDWSDALIELTTKGLIAQFDSQFCLTPEGESWRLEIHERFPYWRYMYDTFFAHAEGSKAHSTFCTRVYGRDLCQHGMADMQQLAVLLDVLALDGNSRVLDMGCANGRLSEYISDFTGAHVVGVDISPVGIEQAQTRTMGKRDRLHFDVGNIIDWRPAPTQDAGSALGVDAASPANAVKAVGFDTLLLIDTLYFVDIEKALDHAARLVAPGGQIAIFFSQWTKPGSPKEQLNPEKTMVGRALQRRKLPFWTWDFSAQEIAHWRKKLDAAARMRPAFEAEGNVWLYEFRLGEAKNHARTIGPHTRSRYLYLVPM